MNDFLSLTRLAWVLDPAPWRYGLSFLFTFKNIENFLYYWFIVRCAIFFRFIPRRFDDFRVLTTIFVSGYFNYGVLVRAVHHSSMLRKASSRKSKEKLSNRSCCHKTVTYSSANRVSYELAQKFQK